MKLLLVRVLLITSLISFVLITTATPQEAAANASLTERAAGHTAEARIPDLLHQFNDSLQALAAKVSPAVVQITVTGSGSQDDKSKDGASFVIRQRAIGSGVILDPNGHIMTNAHVVEGAQQIRVVLPPPAANSPLEIVPLGKRQVLNARLVGEDKDIDLALLKVEGHDFPTLPLGPTHTVRPGEFVMAIGSPEGLQNSVTLGIVSSVWRQPDPDQPMVYVQTDAPINPGSSGGPLVDLDGYVVGLNTFILSEGGGSEGLGFAIPAAAVKVVYEELRKYGYVHRTEIGVGVQEITPTLATGLGLAQNWGVVISDVEPGGPADAAGLVGQDVIVAIDSHPILGLPGLTASLYLHPPAENLNVVVLRGSQRILLNIPAIEHRDEMDQLAGLVNPNNRIDGLGVFAVDFTPELPSVSPDVRFASGVVVVALSPGPDTQSRSIHAGDIIHALNNAPMKSIEQLRSALRRLKPGDAVVLQIERRGKLHYVAFDME
jgi:serine protease Do